MKLNWRENETLRRWSMTDAPWWQFWMPQSGPLGGLIGGFVITVALIAVFG